VILLIFLAVVSGGIYFSQGKNELTERIVTPQQKNKMYTAADNQVRLPIHFCLYRNRNTVIASKEP
jgi:hypothetical protein